MNLDELNAMKYADLFKLAREKLKITRRMPKEKLIESLARMHQELLSDGNYVSADDTGDESQATNEEEDIPKLEPVRREKRKGKKKSQNGLQKPTTRNCVTAVETGDDSSALTEEEDSLPKPMMKSKKRRNIKSQDGQLSVAQGNCASSDVAADEAQATTEKEEDSKQIPVKRGRKRSNQKSSQPRNKRAKQDAPQPDATFSADEKNETETSALNSTFDVEISEPLKSKAGPGNRKAEVNETAAGTPEPVSKSPINVAASATPVTKKEPESTVRRTFSQPRPARPAAVMPTTPASTRKIGQPMSSAKKPPTGIMKPRAAPNFAEIHQKNFEKMQSVDEYVEKKKWRLEAMQKTSTPAAPAKAASNKGTTPAAPATRFNFVSGLQKPVFTAKGLVEKEKQRVVATVKENLSTSRSSLIVGKKKNNKGSTDNIHGSKLSLNSQKVLKGVRTNRRFELQMQHRQLNSTKQ